MGRCRQAIMFTAVAAEHWVKVTKFDVRANALADRHYSRQKVGSGQFMPPGQTLVLLTRDGRVVFGWRRKHPNLGPDLDGMKGWACTIFRNEGPVLSSELILDAERALRSVWSDCGPDGLYTYVAPEHVKSKNPGACFKHAGWRRRPEKDSRERGRLMLVKSWAEAGVARGR